jgi:arsenate reductase
VAEGAHHRRGQGVESVRPVRDEIEARIRGLLAELDVPVR